ncbi:hypothetical protein B566_EDAN002009 [Ephemera danica]|nr:hypothetical protein B566_EDAN002009 [Ephemera danica]
MEPRGVLLCVVMLCGASTAVRQGVAGCPIRRILHPRTGELHCPLSTTACPYGQWIVQLRDDKGEHRADCKSAPCSTNSTVLWNDGKCHEPEEEGLCAKGMRLYVDRYGEPYCDCKPNHYIWPAHGVCYAAFSKGPCETGSHLRLLGSGKGVPVCQRNACIWDNLVRGTDGKCHELGNPALCPAGRAYMASPETGQVECVSLQFMAELRRDLHGCLAGSRLGLLHTCHN